MKYFMLSLGAPLAALEPSRFRLSLSPPAFAFDLASLSPSNSRAAARAASVGAAPPIIRASSSTRSASFSRTTRSACGRSTTLFEMWKCTWPAAAICGRCVMHSTWNDSPMPRSFFPTTSATRPPMPASISSKISVLPGASAAASVRIASITRESSPPARDARERPQILARRSPRDSTRRRRCRSRSTPTPAARPRTALRTACAPSPARRAAPESGGRTASPPRAACATAPGRASETRSRAARVSASRPARRSSAFSSASSCRDSASLFAITSASVGPYLRLSRSSSASRSSTSCRRAGDASMFSP